MASNKCLMCEHYKEVYMPYIKKMAMDCDLDEHSTGCKKEYIPKKEEKKNERTN